MTKHYSLSCVKHLLSSLRTFSFTTSRAKRRASKFWNPIWSLIPVVHVSPSPKWWIGNMAPKNTSPVTLTFKLWPVAMTTKVVAMVMMIMMKRSHVSDVIYREYCVRCRFILHLGLLVRTRNHCSLIPLSSFSTFYLLVLNMDLRNTIECIPNGRSLSQGH